MSKSSTGTTGNSGVIDADLDPDGVSAALGLGDAPDDEQDTSEVDEVDEDEDEDDGPTLEELAASIAELKRDNAKLKREAAAARVKAKTTPAAGTASEASGDTETVEQAAQRGRDEARLEYGLELAGASIRAALVGIIPETELDDFVEDVRLERYVGDDGKPDADAIKALKERQAKITRRRTVRSGNGRNGAAPSTKSKGDLLNDTLGALGI